MDAQDEQAETSLVEETQDADGTAPQVGSSEFDVMVREAIEPLGGKLLFEICIDDEKGGRHVAAATIGAGEARQCLVLSLPVSGGKLVVETAAQSTSPAASLAESLAGVVEAFDRAA